MSDVADTEEIARELDALLVRELRKVNAAVERLKFSVEPQVRAAIDECVEAAAKSHRWEGSFTLVDDSLWLAPPEWIVRNEGDAASEDAGYLAHVSIESKPDGATGVAGADHSWLVSLCDQGRDTFGIWLNWDRELATNKKAWNKTVKSMEDVVASLVQLGYVFDEGSGSFYRQVALSAEALADGLTARDLGDFLLPLEKALEELPDAMAVFQKFVDAVRPVRRAD